MQTRVAERKPVERQDFQLVVRLSDELWKVLVAGLVDLAFECGFEDGDGGLGGQPRCGIAEAAPAQHLG
jgi:hypothetical protein